ncbi:hypothetical protein KHM83_19415 [Fusibacter paucivorans]|uniref:LXG domain of WXG superfamily protein n=1 Tax=Fusibacter paucivorans TaxID=76009 RepID=A0ABS5PVR9_9FIRM|nr:hypothetical protein [Fusibacter paucivorans]MBS7528841.1 hypothetical protein [Fusibacter paucivorans]
MERIISNLKKSIKTVSVNISGQNYQVPIGYSMSSYEVYGLCLKNNQDKDEAFYNMLFEMMKTNWKVINSEIPFTLALKDMNTISPNDGEHIIEVIYQQSGYLSQLENVLRKKDIDFIEKYALLHEMEKEELQKLNRKIKTMTDATFKGNLSSISQVINISKNYSKFGGIYNHIEAITKMNELFSNNLWVMEQVQLQNALNTNRAIIEAANMFSQPALKAIENMKEVTRIFEPKIFNDLKFDLINNSKITSIIEKQRVLFSETMMGYQIAFQAQDKLNEFVRFTDEVSRRITPFLFDINTIKIAQNHLQAYLKKKTKKIYGLGWCIGNIEQGEAIDLLYSGGDNLSDDEVSVIIIEHFDNNNFEELDKLVANWENFNYYQPFKKMADDAVELYKIGKYWPGVDAFTTMLEGAIRNFANDRYKVFETSIWKYITPLKKESGELMDYLTEYFFVQFKAYYSSFSPDSTDAVPDFNRNKIKHGISSDYDKKEYALKLILMVNDILMIISSISEIEVA